MARTSPRGARAHRSRARFAFAFVPLALLLAASCAEIVGVADEFKSAVGAMCTCENVAQTYGGSKTACVDHFNGLLAEGKPSDVRAWLDVYTELACDKCGDTYGQTKLACVHSKPFCAEDGAACTSAVDCCGYPGSSACVGATVGVGICGACKAEGDACATDEECCGYHGANGFLGFDPPYCNQKTGTCVREPADCSRTGSSCLTRPCCEGDLFSVCETSNPNSVFRYCIELCDPANPHNCPGCCAVTFKDDVDPQATGICLDGEPDHCGLFCTHEGEPCANGGTCLRSCEPVAGVLVSMGNCYLTCL
ncbi:MAG: hypothetical protein U0414_20005 [Polyangiaceae bacterium]